MFHTGRATSMFLSPVAPLSMLCLQLTVFGRILMSQPGINVYDIRKECVGPLCYDFSDADKYLNRSAHHTHHLTVLTAYSCMCPVSQLCARKSTSVASIVTGIGPVQDRGGHWCLRQKL